MSLVNFTECLCKTCKKAMGCHVRNEAVKHQRLLITATKPYDPAPFFATIDFCVRDCKRYEEGETENPCGVMR